MRRDQVTEALGIVWRGRQGAASCPVSGHGQGRGDAAASLSVGIGRNGRLLFHCHAGCAPADVLREVRALAGGSTLRAGHDGLQAAPVRRDITPLLRRLWDEAIPVAGTPAGRWLARRGIVAGTSALRFHPAVGHPEVRGRFPVMLAPLRTATGDIVALQRTYLTDGGGRAAIEPARATLGSPGRASVQLAPCPDGLLGLAEGVETALSAAAIFGLPVWAACGARLHRVEIPAHVRTVRIFADHDEAGLRTARRAATQLGLGGRSVEMRRPVKAGEDWNDVLMRSEGGGDGPAAR